MSGKRGFSVVWDPTIAWILAIIGLVLFVVLAGVLLFKGGGGLEFLKNLMRFGR